MVLNHNIAHKIVWKMYRLHYSAHKSRFSHVLKDINDIYYKIIDGGVYLHTNQRFQASSIEDIPMKDNKILTLTYRTIYGKADPYGRAFTRVRCQICRLSYPEIYYEAHMSYYHHSTLEKTYKLF